MFAALRISSQPLTVHSVTKAVTDHHFSCLLTPSSQSTISAKHIKGAVTIRKRTTNPITSGLEDIILKIKEIATAATIEYVIKDFRENWNGRFGCSLLVIVNCSGERSVRSNATRPKEERNVSAGRRKMHLFQNRSDRRLRFTRLFVIAP